MNGMIEEAIPTARPFSTISRSAAEPKLERLAAVADHPDADHLLAPGLAVVLALAHHEHRRVGEIDHQEQQAEEQEGGDRGPRGDIVVVARQPDRPADDHHEQDRRRDEEDEGVDQRRARRRPIWRARPAAERAACLAPRAGPSRRAVPGRHRREAGARADRLRSGRRRWRRVAAGAGRCGPGGRLRSRGRLGP